MIVGRQAIASSSLTSAASSSAADEGTGGRRRMNTHPGEGLAPVPRDHDEARGSSLGSATEGRYRDRSVASMLSIWSGCRSCMAVGSDGRWLSPNAAVTPTHASATATQALRMLSPCRATVAGSGPWTGLNQRESSREALLPVMWPGAVRTFQIRSPLPSARGTTTRRSLAAIGRRHARAAMRALRECLERLGKSREG